MIKAQAFQKPPCTYQLMTNDGGQSDVFNINGNTGTVELMRVLDYEKDARTYYMKVKAVEPTNPPRSSTVSVSIRKRVHRIWETVCGSDELNNQS